MEESSEDELQELPTRKRGRSVLLGEDTERQLQLYLKKIRDQGGVVTASIAILLLPEEFCFQQILGDLLNLEAT